MTRSAVTRPYALDINNLGQVIGYAYNGAGYHGFVWENGVTTDLQTLGGADSQAYYANDLGEVVGWSEDQFGVQTPFLYSPDGGMSPLPSPPDAYWTAAWWNNNVGDVVGVSGYDFTPSQVFFLSADGSGYTFGPPDQSAALETLHINDAGEVVGATMDLTNYSFTPFYFHPDHGYHVLDDLIVNRPEGLLDQIKGLKPGRPDHRQWLWRGRRQRLGRGAARSTGRRRSELRRDAELRRHRSVRDGVDRAGSLRRLLRRRVQPVAGRPQRRRCGEQWRQSTRLWHC